MDCSHFRKHHVAYVDDTLPADLMRCAERHLVDCAACQQHDAAVRRSLLVARNLPAIQPSDGFAARLAARLEVERAACRAERALARSSGAAGAPAVRRARRPAAAAGGWRRAAMAASALLTVSGGMMALRWQRAPEVAVRQAVMAARPARPAVERAPSLVGLGRGDLGRLQGPATAGMAGGAYAGVAVWPAAIIAGATQVELLPAALDGQPERGDGVQRVNYMR